MSIESVYQSLLKRSPDQGAYGTYDGWSDDDIANAIYGSQEFANLQQQSQPQEQPQEQQQIPTGGGGGNPQADLNAIYQQYLGRGVDPSGAATFAGMDTQSVINAILGSQEYANRQGGGGGGGGGGNNVYVPGPSVSEYNFEMTGKPSDVELATNSDMANAWYKYSGTSPAPAMNWQTAPDNITYNPVQISQYQNYGLAQPFNTSDIQATVNPNDIHYGYNNTPYAGVKSNVPGLSSGGEYVVNPQTGKFVLDKNGNPTPVPQEPYKQGTFDTIMSDYLIPGFIAAAAIPVLGGLGGQLFSGLGALGEGGIAGGELFGPTYGELGYTGLEAGQFGPTYAELGYTGLNNAAAISAADAAAASYAAQQAAPGLAKTLGTSLSTASTLAKLLGAGSSLFSGAKSPGASAYLPTALRGITPTGTMPTGGSTPIQVNAGSNQSALPGIYGEQFSPFAFGNQQPVQTPRGGGYDFLSALNKPVDTSLLGQMKNVTATNNAQNQAQNAKTNFFSSLLS